MSFTASYNGYIRKKEIPLFHKFVDEFYSLNRKLDNAWTTNTLNNEETVCSEWNEVKITGAKILVDRRLFKGHNKRLPHYICPTIDAVFDDLMEGYKQKYPEEIDPQNGEEMMNRFFMTMNMPKLSVQEEENSLPIYKQKFLEDYGNIKRNFIEVETITLSGKQFQCESDRYSNVVGGVIISKAYRNEYEFALKHNIAEVANNCFSNELMNLFDYVFLYGYNFSYKYYLPGCLKSFAENCRNNFPGFHYSGY